jgi:hypothetical protein
MPQFKQRFEDEKGKDNPYSKPYEKCSDLKRSLARRRHLSMDLSKEMC